MRNQNRINERIKCVSIRLFFFSLLLLGLSTYRDYGISWDEPTQRLTGEVTVNYLAKTFHTPPFLMRWKPGVLALDTYKERVYGVAFEAPAFGLEQILRLKDSRHIYMLRHLLTFLASFGGVYAVYRLSYRRFLDWRIGLLSAFFLVLTPRFFAESFYNSKDIVFMAVFATAMNTTISFVLRPGIKTTLVHALASAVAIDVRIMALLLVVVSVMLLIIRLIRRELQVSRTRLLIALYVMVTSALVIVMWPYLWSNPLGHFVEAFKTMAHFPSNSEVRYMGAFIPTTKLPWHYTLTWISITTPLLYIALFLVGVFATCCQILRRGFKLWHDDGELQDILFLGLFVAPISAVLLFHSELYDGWRHLYFIYPSFLLLSTKGWVAVWSMKSTRNVYKAGLITLTAISLFSTAIWMWKAHPLQNVYFNVLAGKNVKARYEMDYWGLGNRKALEYILEKDHSAVVNVWADSFTPISNSVLMLKGEDRSRVRIGNDKRIPYYVLTNYRSVKDTDDAKYGQEYELFYQMRVGDEVVLSVFKWKGPPPTTGNSSVGGSAR
jgi:hypothetical protein